MASLTLYLPSPAFIDNLNSAQGSVVATGVEVISSSVVVPCTANCTAPEIDSREAGWHIPTVRLEAYTPLFAGVLALCVWVLNMLTPVPELFQSLWMDPIEIRILPNTGGCTDIMEDVATDDNPVEDFLANIEYIPAPVMETEIGNNIAVDGGSGDVEAAAEVEADNNLKVDGDGDVEMSPIDITLVFGEQK